MVAENSYPGDFVTALHSIPLPCHALRVLIASILLACTILITSSAVFAAPEENSSDNSLEIKIARGNWGQVELADIQRLLTLVANEFQSYVDFNRERELKIRVIPRSGPPRVLYELGLEGEYVVHLSARDKRWYQYAYQFAHELCHIYSNFDYKERNDKDEITMTNQWFEESLCEAASIFTLQSLAESWEQSPPTRNLVGYAQVFASYAEHLLAQAHRHLPSVQYVDHWYEEHQASLRENPYLREKNELVATALLQMFEQDPHLLQAISYLNRDKSSAGKDFYGYLTDWHRASPPRSKMLAAQAMVLFGNSSPQYNRP